MAKVVCENCKHWAKLSDLRENGSQDQGQCRKYPPQMISSNVNSWPVTNKDEWCGDFEVLMPGQVVGGEG